MSIIGPRPGDVESKDTYAQDEKDKLSETDQRRGI